ncbi:MAG: universal stress protein [Candidatus Dormibacteraeota bacterium]|nr:universal stress protein [Candidatus Dormibacteraeota bacterium]
MFERILLSVDGSTDSDKAGRATRDLARMHGSEVFVVHGRDLAIVGPPAPTSPVPPRQAGDDDEEEARLVVDMAVAELRSGEVTASGRVLPSRGAVAPQILEAARSTRADLIVLGSRGMSRLKEIVIGSASHGIIRSADRPVLLVR